MIFKSFPLSGNEIGEAVLITELVTNPRKQVGIIKKMSTKIRNRKVSKHFSHKAVIFSSRQYSSLCPFIRKKTEFSEMSE